MAVSQAVLELLVRMKDEASSGLGSLGGALGNVGMIAGGAALAGVVALGAAIVGGTGDALEARQLYASTEQTILTMGNAAGRSADQVVDLASSLSDAAGMSLFGDDQIQQSENLLLTFGNIKGETFDLATALTVDLAQALGGAPADQAMMLGKALNDPIKGISALGKAGLTFSEEQKAAIAAMVETGDVAGAQAIIIKELNAQVGGQAAAAAKAAGGMVQFKAGLGETFETIGAELLPVLDQLGAWLASPDVQAAIKVFATSLAQGIRIAADFLTNQLMPALKEVWDFISPVLIPVITFLADAIGKGLVLQVNTLVFSWNAMKEALSNFKTDYIDPIVRGWEAVTGAITTAHGWFQTIGTAISSISIPSWLQGHSPPPLAEWFDMIGASAANSGSAIGDLLSKLGSSAVSGIAGLFGGNTSGEPMQALIGDILGQSSKGTVNFDELSDILSKQLPAGLADQISKIALGMAEGSGTAGAMGTMIRDLILANQDGQTALVNTIADAMLASTVPAGSTAPPPSGMPLGGSPSGVAINLSVQGSVVSAQDLVLYIRDELVKLGMRNVTAFGG